MSLLGRLLTLPGVGRALLFSTSTQNPATAPGDVLPVGVTLIPGTATGGAVATGDTIEADALLIPGEAREGAFTPAATVVAPVSLLDGTATGGAVAGGADLLTVVTLIPGRALVYVEQQAPAVLSAPIPQPEPPAPARVLGATLGATATLIPGTATGGAAAGGQTVNALWLHYYAPRWTAEQRTRIEAEDRQLLDSLLIWN